MDNERLDFFVYGPMKREIGRCTRNQLFDRRDLHIETMPKNNEGVGVFSGEQVFRSPHQNLLQNRFHLGGRLKLRDINEKPDRVGESAINKSAGSYVNFLTNESAGKFDVDTTAFI